MDIQAQAVQICELRLWLSLVVDYELPAHTSFTEAIRQVPALPNLAYKVCQGDSLLERLFGQAVQLDELSRDRETRELIESASPRPRRRRTSHLLHRRDQRRWHQGQGHNESRPPLRGRPFTNFQPIPGQGGKIASLAGIA